MASSPSSPVEETQKSMKPSQDELDNVESPIFDFGAEVEPLIRSDGMRSEEDKWEMLVEEKVIAKGETLASQAQPGISVQQRKSDGSDKEKPPWWARIKKSREATESKV